MSDSIGTQKAADILKCKRETIRQMCKDGLFPSANQDANGSTWHLSEQEVKEFDAWRAGRKTK